MIRFLRDLRLIPIAVIASACLLALKTAEFVLDRGYLIGTDTIPASDDMMSVVHVGAGAQQANGAPRSWAQQMFNFPNSSGVTPADSAAPLPQLPSLAPLSADRAGADITGSVGGDGSDDKADPKAPDAKAADAKAADGKPADGKAKSAPAAAPAKDAKDAKPAGGTVIPADGSPVPSGAERAILERLAQRRQELDTRARELDIREGLIQAAEKRVEAKLTELKQVESQIAVAAEKKDQAEAARFKGLVTMYENMKPRDAAKIFDHLDLNVLLEVASQINPRNMSEILAQMSAESAERLTVELAARAQAAGKGPAGGLPKIEGQPAAQ